MKRKLLRQLRVKGIQPFALEINRVRQNQIRVRGDHAIGDAGDAAVRLVARPLVDLRLRRRRLAKIQRLDGGREIIPVRLEEAGLHRRARPIPQRIGRGQNEVRILRIQQTGGGLARRVQRRRRKAGRFQDLLHFRFRLAGRTIGRHLQRRRRAVRRNEKARARLVGGEFLEQLEGERVVGRGEFGQIQIRCIIVLKTGSQEQRPNPAQVQSHAGDFSPPDREWERLVVHKWKAAHRRTQTS